MSFPGGGCGIIRKQRILICPLHNTRRPLNVIYRQRMRMRLLLLLIIRTIIWEGMSSRCWRWSTRVRRTGYRRKRQRRYRRCRRSWRVGRWVWRLMDATERDPRVVCFGHVRCGLAACLRS